MNNCYLKNPIKVVVYDPKDNKNLQTYVFVGDIPSFVRNSIYSYKNIADRIEKKQSINKNDAKKHARVLQDFYGDSWERKLHMPRAGSKLGGGSTRREIKTADRMFAGGDDSSDLAGIDIGEIDRLLNLDTANHIENDNTVKRDSDNLYSTDAESQITTELKDAEKASNSAEGDFMFASDQPLVSTNISRVDFKAKYGRNGGVSYINDVHIFPEDKISDVKNKIFMSINIPTYRQHLYWNKSGRVTTSYKLYTNKIHPVDIRDLFKSTAYTHKQEIIGIPIDRELYNERDELKIDASDAFLMIADIDDWYETFYICDIAEYIDSKRAQILNIIKDKYQLDLFYYGFVVKYWPQLVHEAFIEYAISENGLMQKFPDLSRSILYINKIYDSEADILDKNYKSVKKIIELDSATKSSKKIFVALTNTTATTNTEPKMIVNIRNMFDKLRANKYYPEIHAFIEHNNTTYLLEKTYAASRFHISFPTNMKMGIVIAINITFGAGESANKEKKLQTSTQERFMFLNILPNGRYYVKATWIEEEENQFDTVLQVMKKFVDPLFKIINSLGKYVFSHDPAGKGLLYLTEHTVKYSSLNVSILWKHVMSLAAYRFVRSLWEPYIRAGILSPHGVSQSDVTSFMFHKGMVEFDPYQIDRVMNAARIVASKNQYAYLTNSTIKQKWNQLYSGRIFKMIHRTTDIKFEAINMHEKEFRLLHRYILVFVSAALCDSRFRDAKAEKTYNVGSENVKKLRKLQETDPDLYNLKKYGSKKMYSILCQNPRQPIVYTNDEIEQMSSKDKAKLTQYWNFTLDREAYYGCNNPKYPHMSFIVGFHPKNYCLPCCSKKSFIGEESKKTQINKICLNNYEFTKDDEFAEAKSRHIMVYGKTIDAGRISQLPGSAIRDLLYNSLADGHQQYYIFGVEQNFPSVRGVGLLYSLAESLSTTPQKLVSDLIKELEKLPEIFKILLNGTLIMSFNNLHELTDTMRSLFIDRNKSEFSSAIGFKKWSELFSELAMLFLRVYIFTFIDYTGKGESTDLFISDAMKSELLYLASAGVSASEDALDKKYILMIKRQAEYYPIFVIDSRVFFKTNMPSQKLFTGTADVVKNLYSLVSSSIAIKANIAGEKTTERHLTLQVLKEFIEDTGAYVISKKFINKRNLCYAILLTSTKNNGGTHNVYAPVEYSPHINDEIPVDFSLFENELHEVFAEDVIKYAETINDFIKKKYMTGSSLYGAPIYEYKLVNFDIIYSYAADNSTNNNRMVSSALADNMYYFEPIPLEEASKLFDKFGAKVKNIKYRYEDINKAIARDEKPSKIQENLLIGALYKNYLYQLFTLEFVNYVGKEINSAVREGIIKRINATDFKKNFTEFQSKIEEILSEFPDDIKTLKSQISSFYYGDFDKKKLVENINLTRYQFDNITINRLKKLTRNEIKEEIKIIASEFVSETEFDPGKSGEFPNIYLPCEIKHDHHGENNKPYCAGKKLIVGDELNALSDILSSDIINPLKEKYLLSSSFSDNLVEYFKFESHPLEIIVITKIE